MGEAGDISLTSFEGGVSPDSFLFDAGCYVPFRQRGDILCNVGLIGF